MPGFVASVKLQAFNPFSQIKTIQIVERHQMSIPTKYIHEVPLHTYRLPISCARFLTDYFSACFIVYYLLFCLFLS